MRQYRVELVSEQTRATVCAEYIEAINEHYAIEKANEVYAPHFYADRSTVVEVLNEH